MKKLILILALGLLPVLTLVPAVATQAQPLEEACNQAETNTNERPAICDTPDENPLTGSDGVIVKVTNLLALVTGVAAVLIIILAGLQYVTSGGEPSKINGARQAIIFAAVGLVVVLLARTVVAFIIRRF